MTRFGEFRQFGNILKVFWQFLNYYFEFFIIFGKFYAFGRIPIAINGPISKNNLAIWSHCPELVTKNPVLHRNFGSYLKLELSKA